MSLICIPQVMQFRREYVEWRSYRENGEVTLQLFTTILDRKATFPKR